HHLSPEHQFPAPLCDALAAYLYLINLGLETGFKPFDPKQIIFSGSSAVVGHPSFTKVPRFKLYCVNEALAIPHISSMWLKVGKFTTYFMSSLWWSKISDSNILFSFKASNPSRFQLPKYATTNFINSAFKNPIDAILEVYDGTCHCFQKIIPDKISQFSINRSCDFIKNHMFKKNTSDEAANKINENSVKILIQI
ncbi:37234_t:CDS:2, partial [Gigaspora margarita]